MKSRITLLALSMLSALSFAAPVVQFDTTLGTIEVTLDPEHAPETVANFITYVKAGQYNGTLFHRVIPNFVIQGGGYTPDMTEKPTRPPIKNESNNGLKNQTGTIAMARKMDPHSATAQFYINVAPNAALDYQPNGHNSWGYTVFGNVTRGMDVVEKIARVPTGNKQGMADVPLKSVVIQKAFVKP